MKQAMKHKVAELSGAFLDAAVALSAGASDVRLKRFDDGQPGPWCISSINALEPVRFTVTDELLVRLIEHEHPHINPPVKDVHQDLPWRAVFALGLKWSEGDTMRTAVLRAYAASKFGEEVDLPEVEG